MHSLKIYIKGLHSFRYLGNCLTKQERWSEIMCLWHVYLSERHYKYMSLIDGLGHTSKDSKILKQLIIYRKIMLTNRTQTYQVVGHTWKFQDVQNRDLYQRQSRSPQNSPHGRTFLAICRWKDKNSACI